MDCFSIGFLRRLLICLVVSGVAVPARAQTTTDAGAWVGFVAQGGFGADSRWNWSAHSLLRTRDVVATLDAVGLRGIIGRRIGARSTVGGGYFVARAYRSGGSPLTEQRFLQQHTLALQAGPTSVSLRTRLEERLVTGNSHAAVRLREQVRLTVPLSTTRRTSLVLSDEVFLHLNATSLFDRGFDSHRFYAGIRQTVGPRTAVDVGYYNIYAHGRNGANRRNHALSAAAGVSF